MAKPSACVPVDSLVDLACRDGVDVRPTLARVLTDLYVQRPSHSGEEETQYVELVLGLIDSVDAKTRAAVAEKLRQYPKAPAAVLRRLDSLAAANPADDENSEDLLELFFSSAPEERRLILTNLDVVSDPTRRRPVPSEGELVRRLERAALRRNPSEFSRILARALNISQGLAERISFDDSGARNRRGESPRHESGRAAKNSAFPQPCRRPIRPVYFRIVPALQRDELSCRRAHADHLAGQFHAAACRP